MWEKGNDVTEPPNLRSISTFIVRFCRSCQNNGLCWRGRIEHVQSGRWLSFFRPADMLTFIRSFDIVLEDLVETDDGSRMKG
jgi:hypothetical protein